MTSKGEFAKTEKFLRTLAKGDIFKGLERSAKQGVAALAAATPIDTSETKAAWGYEISRTRGQTTIAWTNGHTEGGAPVVIMLQYGHGTGTGGYVAGRDFINPALKPIFDKIADDVWKAVISA